MSGAIETFYRGHLFRSRLEARWAVLLDSLGVEWKYEHQGYEVDDARYLPDFWLPASEVWLEVKGDSDSLRSEFTRMVKVFGPRSPLPGFTEGRSAVALVSDIPEVSYGVTVLHPVLSRASGILGRTFGFFVPTKSGGAGFVWDRNQSVLYLPFRQYATTDMSDSPDGPCWDVKPWVLDTPVTAEHVHDAYRAGRRARFEHGANGR